MPGQREDTNVAYGDNFDGLNASAGCLLEKYSAAGRQAPSRNPSIGVETPEDTNPIRHGSRQDNLHVAVDVRPRVPRHATDGGVCLAGGNPLRSPSGVPELVDDQRSDSESDVSTLPPPYFSY